MRALDRRGKRGQATGRRTPPDTRPARADATPFYRGRCACGGGCPRCRAHQAGATPGAGAAPATPVAAAPSPGPATITLLPVREGAAASKQHDASRGVVAWWNVNISGPPGRWLIQHVYNDPLPIRHCQQPPLGEREPYPPADPINPEPTSRYYEAFWIDAAGQAQIPTSTATPPTVGSSGFFGDDSWNFAVRSARPTAGALLRTAELYVVPTLPPEFGIGNVPEAVDLPSTVTTSAALGSPVAQRGALVSWDYCHMTPGQPDPAWTAGSGRPRQPMQGEAEIRVWER